MRVKLVRVGNSRGVRIPKPILEQCGLRGSVELTVREDALVITPARRAREGWEEAFRAMAERGDDRLLETPAAGWDEAEWRW